MVRVLCTLPNAGDEISGVRFESCPEGKISEPISPEVAALFLRVDGYRVSPEPDQVVDPVPELRRTRGRPPTAKG